MSEPSAEALAAKQAATQAWSTGDWAEAVSQFTAAIDAGGDAQFQRVMYSNRSAAYLKMGNKEKALSDANTCISLDSNWVKGYSRKGDALLALKRFTDAYNAYNSGLRVAPNDGTMKEKSEQAMKAIRNAANATSPSFSSSSSNSSSYSVYEEYALIALIICAILYAIPFFSLSYRTTAYRLAAAISTGVSGTQLYRKHGVPKFNNEYAQRLIQEPETMQIFLSSLLLVSRPYLLALMPLLLNAARVFVAPALRSLERYLPRFQQLVAQYVPSMSSADAARLLSPSNSRNIETQLMKASASCEVLQGLYLVFELLLPSRNFIQLYIWSQYLKMRYISDSNGGQGHVKAAFSLLDQRINALLAHNMCPALLRQVYGYARNFIISQGKLPEQSDGSSGSGGGGIMGNLASAASKCNIM